MRLEVGDLGPGDGVVPRGPGTEQDLSAAMGELSRSLHDRRGSVAETLQEIVEAAVVNVPGARCAGVTVAVGRGRLDNAAATDALPQHVAELQTGVQQGPCLEALYERRPVAIGDLRAERRWPAFTAGMAGLPVRSMLSLPLHVREDGLGSLSLYADLPGVFGERSLEIGLVFASHAAVALAGARTEEGLRQALDSRDVIGQAKGILMERYGLDEQRAFLLLVRLSQQRNVKLRELATHLAGTGSLDETGQR